MKRWILISALTFASQVALAANQYKVTVTNLTRGQPFSPFVLAVHSTATQLYPIGKPSSTGLWKVAEDGQTADLEKELSANTKVTLVQKASGPTLPGQSTEFLLPALRANQVLSLVSMIARTNDGLVAAQGLTLPRRVGQKYVTYGHALDAGSEENNESCAFIPAPPCGNPGKRATENAEGFLHPHPGIQNIGDLNATRDAFAPTVALISIERIH